MAAPTEQMIRKMNLLDILAEDFPDVACPPDNALEDWSEDEIRNYYGCSKTPGGDGTTQESDRAPVPKLTSDEFLWTTVDDFPRQREVFAARQLACVAAVQRATLVLRGAGPQGHMEVRAYRPKEQASGGRWPGLVFVMGGAYKTCAMHERDFLCQNLARGGFCVFQVQYRSEEAGGKHPDAAEDVYSALSWLALGEHADALRYDASQLVLVGDSAGGHVCNAVAHMAARRTGPVLAGQVLVCPGLNYALAPPGMFQYFKDVDHEKDVCANPLSSFHTRELMRQLPPTLIVSTADDQWEDVMQLSTSAARYAARLKDAGVPIGFRHYHGKPRRVHVFFCTDMVGRSIFGMQALADTVEWIQAAALKMSPSVPACEFDDPERLKAHAET